MSETLVLFIIGALLTVIQMLTGIILAYIIWEIRRLRDHIHALDGASKITEGILRAKGYMDTRRLQL